MHAWWKDPISSFIFQNLTVIKNFLYLGMQKGQILVFQLFEGEEPIPINRGTLEKTGVEFRQYTVLKGHTKSLLCFASTSLGDPKKILLALLIFNRVKIETPHLKVPRPIQKIIVEQISKRILLSGCPSLSLFFFLKPNWLFYFFKKVMTTRSVFGTLKTTNSLQWL